MIDFKIADDCLYINIYLTKPDRLRFKKRKNEEDFGYSFPIRTEIFDNTV